MLLFRPVGLAELLLIDATGMRAFPPRLPGQPIFYPVLNDGYARQIARDWNTKEGTRAGFVTRFCLDDTYAARFERHVVGGGEHEELWVPAEQLAEFNRHVAPPIAVTAAFLGDGWAERVEPRAGVAAMFVRLASQSEPAVARQLADAAGRLRAMDPER